MSESACRQDKGILCSDWQPGGGGGGARWAYIALWGFYVLVPNEKVLFVVIWLILFLNKLIQSKWQDSGLFLAHYPTVILTSRFVSKSMN